MQATPAGFERRQKAPALRHEEIGGGKVRQAFRNGTVLLRPGTIMSREEILAIPYANRVALLDRFIEVWPIEAIAKKGPPAPEAPAETFIIHVGGGKYNVIRGAIMNEVPLQKHEADDLVKELG